MNDQPKPGESETSSPDRSDAAPESEQSQATQALVAEPSTGEASADEIPMNDQPKPGESETSSPDRSGSGAASEQSQATPAPVAEPSTGEASADEPLSDDGDDEYTELFQSRSFGGEFIWAEATGYVAKILRVRSGQNVVVSTQGRRDMVVMLTGGRAVLETKRGSETEHTELLPAEPQTIRAEQSYRLLALSEVELFTIYTSV